MNEEQRQTDPRTQVKEAFAWYLFWYSLDDDARTKVAERFMRPWAIATYNTVEKADAPAATTDEIEKATSALKALGDGRLSSAILPDSCKLKVEMPTLTAYSAAMSLATIDSAEEHLVLVNYADFSERYLALFKGYDEPSAT